MLQIQVNHLEVIAKHAKNTYPEECCGLLLGNINPDGKVVTAVWQTENNWTPEQQLFFHSEVSPSASKKNRFSISPLQMLSSQKKARELNLTIVGIYHSHPEHPAIPSEFDRSIAWAEYSYLIVAVNQGKIKEVLSWKLNQNQQFQPEKLIISGLSDNTCSSKLYS